MTFSPLATNAKQTAHASVHIDDEGGVPAEQKCAPVDEGKKKKVMLWLLVQARREQRLGDQAQVSVCVGPRSPQAPRRHAGAKSL